ncbi:MAG TPA: FAD-dependent monooxygenase [Pseudonocardiaceae bacterium]|nr:FAD-dependent monooxygenase [Pseudonocardiaceae bacterium]
MKVLIVGAGVAGMTAALSLHAAGVRTVRIVESAGAPCPVGGGLTLLPNAVRELAALGLFDAVAAAAVPVAELVLHNGNGDVIWREPRGQAAGHRWPQLGVHGDRLRTALTSAVRSRLGADAITTDARVTECIDATGARPRIRLTTSSWLDADVVIGADGGQSAVRARLYPAEGKPRSTGQIMLQGTAWRRPYLTGRSMVVAGDGRRGLVVYPITEHGGPPGKVLLNWVITQPADARGHGDWPFDWLDVPAMPRATANVVEYPVVHRYPLPRWSFGRLTLLGDAAHPMYPTDPNGATQAIVDARSLAYHLATYSDITEALARYDADRRPTLAAIHEVVTQHQPADIAASYPRISGADPRSCNTPSPYTVHTARPRQSVR